MSTQNNAENGTGRWASEGGADPLGPATEMPAREAANIPEPPGTPQQIEDPPLAQEQIPPPGESAPEDIGESGESPSPSDTHPVPLMEEQ